MSDLDRAAGTLELEGTLDLRRCPVYDPTLVGFSPCNYPTEAAPDGSVTVALTATRCESLEDALPAAFW